MRDRRIGRALLTALSSLCHRTTIWQLNWHEGRRYLPFREAEIANPYLLARGEIERIWDSEDLRGRQILDLDRFSLPHLMHQIDRCSMGHSLDVRMPFLDHNFVNFAVSLAPEVLLRRGWPKHVLRAAFPELPRSVRWRRDSLGFSSAEEKWLKEDLGDLIRRTFNGSALAAIGAIDDAMFLRHYDRYKGGERGISRKGITRVLMAEAWVQTVCRGRAFE